MHSLQGILTLYCQQWIALPNKKINEDIAALNDIVNQMDLIDIYKTFHPKEAKYKFLSNVHGSFSKTDYTAGHKQNFKKSRKLKSYQASSRITLLETRNQPQGKNSKTFKYMETT